MSKNESQSVGERIKLLREKKGESQEKLGEAIGLSQNSISKLEKGETQLTLDNQHKIAEHFNVSHDYICTGKDNASVLILLEKYISLEFTSISEGDNLNLKFPVLKIKKYFFDYLMKTAIAQNEKYIPDDVKELWIEKETHNFYEQYKNEPVEESISIVPVPQNLIYSEDKKNVQRQSDLLRELNKLLLDSTW